MEKINEEITGTTSKGKTKKTFTYKFLKQDFRIKEKDRLINATDGDLNTNNVGTVISIDENKQDVLKNYSWNEVNNKFINMVK